MRGWRAWVAVVLALVGTPAAAEAPARIAVRILPEGAGAEAEAASGVLSRLDVPTVVLVPISELGLEASEPESVGSLEDRARGLELQLKFRAAANVWQELVEALASDRILLLNPQRVARAQVALAAAYAESGESELAVLRFREALALDASFAPGPEYAPRVRELFERARAQGPALPAAPKDALLDRIATEAGVAGVLWLAVGHAGERLTLVRRLRLAGAGRPAAEVRRPLPAEAEGAADVLETDAAAIEAALLTAFPGPEPPPPPPPPWYRRGWVVGTAGGVAAAVVTGVLLAHFLGSARVDVVIEH